MSIRERMHQLIDQMPEEDIQQLELMIALAKADDDDEPSELDDPEEIRKDLEEYRQRQTMPAADARRELSE